MIIRKLTILIFFLSFFSSTGVIAQNDSKIDSLETLINSVDSDIEKIDLVLSLAKVYRTQIPSKAISLSLEMKVLSDSLSYKKGQYLSRRLLAQSYAGLSNFQEAISYANQAKTFLNEDEDSYEKALLKRILGLVYSGLGELDKASKCYFTSLQICESLGNKACLSSSYNGIGDLFFERKDYKMALKYYSDALAISRKLNDLVGVSRGLNNIAIVFSSDEKEDKALPLLFEASEINQILGERLWEGINYLNIAENYRTHKDYDLSLPYYLKADSIFTELKHYILKAKTYISISKYYFDINDEKHSIKYANLAFKISDERDYVLVKNRVSEWMYELYSDIGNEKKAFHYGLIHFQLKDSLEIEKNAIKLSQMELLYQLEKKDQLRKIEQHKKDTRYIVAILTTAFVGLLIVILLRARYKIKVNNDLLVKKQLEAKIEIKDRELVVNVMSLLKKNEVLANIVDNLMQVHDKAVKEETKIALIKIAKDIQESSEVEIWEEFEVRFKQAHGEYYDRLFNKFPNLSPNELKLCAFLKLNMSTKDISELTGKSLNSIEIARTRLRKKLGISNTKTNLISFISQI